MKHILLSTFLLLTAISSYDGLPDPFNHSVKKLRCDGFEVTVSAGEQGSISFYTGSWEGTKQERLAAYEEQKRRDFKP